MPAQYAGAGTNVAGVAPLSVTAPSSVPYTVVIFFVMQKEIAGSASIAQTAGPTLVKAGEMLGTAGVGGTDVGPTRIAAFYRVLDGSEITTTYTFTGSSDVMYIAPYWTQSDVGTGTPGIWTINAVVGEDTTAGAALSYTMGSIELAVDDLVIVAGSVPTDVSADFTVEAIAATGFTFGAMAELADIADSTGRDIGGYVFRQYVATGTTASVAPTVTSTVTGTTTSIYGPAILLRLRMVEAPAASVDAAYLLVQPGAIDITDTIFPAQDGVYLYMNTGAAEVVGTRALEGWSFGEDLSGTMSEYYYAPGAGTYLYAHVYGPGTYIWPFYDSGDYLPWEGVTSADVLVVGGGGSGARATRGGGGGGAGGVTYTAGVVVTPGVPIPVVVGAGGADQTALDAVGNSGGASSFGGFAGINVLGGGGGGYRNVAGGSGSSGGGGGGTDAAGTSVPGTGTVGQGYNGGLGLAISTIDAMVGGGGGGAGGLGGDWGASFTSGAGGLGYNATAVFGTAFGNGGIFASGGGGGCRRVAAIPAAVTPGGGGRGADGFSGSAGSPGTRGTGGGGGGGGGETDLANTTVGYAGGSGIVLVKFTVP